MTDPDPSRDPSLPAEGDASTDAAGRYRIGTVSQLTGLDAHTIRAWERRHGAVRPERSDGGTRHYSDEDVARLRLMKALTDCGDPIGRVANLDDASLRERLATLTGTPSDSAPPSTPRESGRPTRLALLAPPFVEQFLAQPSGAEAFDVVLVEDDLDAFVQALSGCVADVLVVGLEGLLPDATTALDRIAEVSTGPRILVVYGFARRRELAALTQRDVQLLKRPFSMTQLADGIAEATVQRREPALLAPSAPLEPGGPAPAPRFSPQQLARLREIASSVECECPNHLSALVESLCSFEQYSYQCESRTPDDRELHQRLALDTGRARSIIEDLLEEVCRRERISI